MPSDDGGRPSSNEGRTLTFLLLATTAAFAWIVLPFYGTLLWAIVISLLFTPVHRRLLAALRGRRNSAALLTVFIVVLSVILPFAVVVGTLTAEAAMVLGRLQSGEIDLAASLQHAFTALPAWCIDALDVVGLGDFAALQQRVIETLTQGSQAIARQVFALGQSTFTFVGSLFVMLYLTFFFVRDGETLVPTLARVLPLSAEHKRELATQFVTVIRATVKGSLLVALVQGTLGGIAFWVLGVNAALLWSVVMTVLSLLPAIGSALVWLPVALYFLATGQYAKGALLAAYGVLVIGLIDNLLRPMLVGKDTRLPDYVVMLTTLGGIAVFGVHGFVLGPAIAAMCMAVWHIYVRAPSAP